MNRTTLAQATMNRASLVKTTKNQGYKQRQKTKANATGRLHASG